MAIKEPALKKKPAAKKQPAAKRQPAAAVKKETAQVSCHRRPSPTPLACHVSSSVLVFRPPLSPTPSGARHQARGGEEGGQYKDGTGAPTGPRDPVNTPDPPCPHLEHAVPAHSKLSVVNQCTSFHLKHNTAPDIGLRLPRRRTTKYSLGTISSARSKSPRSFSTRMRRLRRLWRRRRCGRRAGHVCAPSLTRSVLRGPHCQTLYCAVLSDSYTYPSAPREFLYIGTPTPVRRLHAPLMS